MRPPSRIDHAIAYDTSTPHNRRSAFTLAGRHALVPASVLFGGSLTAQTGKRLAASLLSGHFVDTHAGGDAWSELRSLKLRLVQKSAGGLYSTDASVRYVFNCANIADAVIGLLDGFEPTTAAAAYSRGFNQSTTSAFGMGQCELSAFVVLDMQQEAGGIDHSLERMLESMIRREKDAHTVHIRQVQRLDRVASVTTPFTNEVFFESINMGSVANVFGTNDCLFVVSQALVAGCDGGAVYNERLYVSFSNRFCFLLNTHDSSHEKQRNCRSCHQHVFPLERQRERNHDIGGQLRRDCR